MPQRWRSGSVCRTSRYSLNATRFLVFTALGTAGTKFLGTVLACLQRRLRGGWARKLGAGGMVMDDGSSRSIVRRLVTGVDPYDEREAADQAWMLDWIGSGVELFRLKRSEKRRVGKECRSRG